VHPESRGSGVRVWVEGLAGNMMQGIGA
jgi:hypothetical protein